MSKDDLGDRMKLYEMEEAGRKAMPLLPVLARLDGRGFSKFTKGLERPYSTKLHELMVAVTGILVDETNALIGYTQSDEITLVLYSDDIKSELYFGGRLQKLVSILASSASVHFNRLLPEYLPQKAKSTPLFDCRVWTVPTKEEAANAVLWRERDATKNSVSMAARTLFSHKELQNKSASEMQAMMLQKDVNWNNYPAWFKRGTFVRRKAVTCSPSAELISKLEKLGQPIPESVTRHVLQRPLVPPFGKVTNRVEFIFNGDEARAVLQDWKL
jgi:tRNA(His) guanylyltransferase